MYVQASEVVKYLKGDVHHMKCQPTRKRGEGGGAQAHTELHTVCTFSNTPSMTGMSAGTGTVSIKCL